MKDIRKISMLLLLSSAVLTASPQDQGCTVRKSFRVKEGTWLTVNNKYGDITFITTPSDSLIVCATVTVDHADRDLAAKSIALIKVVTGKKGDTVSVRTVIDDKFFSTQLRAGRKSFSIDYIINLPPNSNLSVKNTFGDVNIDDTGGFIDISLSHGDLTGTHFSRGNIKPVSQLNLENARASISEINWMVINAKHCQQLNIPKARALVLTTEFSKISIGEAGSIVCKSRSDSYTIGSARNIVAESTYSAFDITNLLTRIQAITRYGTIKINEVKNGFTLIDLSSTHTPVDITNQKGNSYKCDISLVSTPVEFDMSENPSVRKLTTGAVTKLTGTAGKNQETASEIKMNLTLGLLKLK